MSYKVNLFYALLLCGILNIALGADDCQKCMANSIYCVNESSYYVCPDGKNPSNKLFTCEKGTVCTDSPDKVCQPPSSNAISVCASSCGVCPDSSKPNKRFACVSRTQFDMCDSNGDPTGLLSSCDAGEVCSAESYEKNQMICVPDCVMDFFEYKPTCSNDEVGTTTLAPIPTQDPESLKEQCKNAGNTSKKSFSIENTEDKTCHSYIICQEFSSEDWDAYEMTCKNGGYFNNVTSKCQTDQPAGCPRTGTPNKTTTEAAIEITTVE